MTNIFVKEAVIDGSKYTGLINPVSCATVENGIASIKVRFNDKISNVMVDPKNISELSDADVTLLRLRDSFSVLETMTESVAAGEITGLVVYGPAGVGKTYNIIKRLEDFNSHMEDLVEGFGINYEMYKGYMTTIALYKLLYKFRHEGNVLVLDDIDTVFGDLESLNLLKAALDTTDVREVSYNAESNALNSEGIPKKFQFNGSIILATNINFEKARGKLRPHLDAIVSRCHYLDLSIETDEDKFMWLYEIAINKGMLVKNGLSEKQAIEVVNFINNHKAKMRELSLRMVLKVADLYKAHGSKWKTMAKITCMKDFLKG